VRSLCRFRVARAFFVGVYRLALRLFVVLLPRKSHTRAVYSKVDWRDCWPGDSDLDLRIVLGDAGDSRARFDVFERQMALVSSYRRVVPMIKHVYVMSESFAGRLAGQGATGAFGRHARVWNRVWGRRLEACETVTTHAGDPWALRGAFGQYSRELLPAFYRTPSETSVFSRRIYTSVIKVLRHCLYYRGEVASTTGSFEAGLDEILRQPSVVAHPHLALLLQRLRAIAARDFRAVYAPGELERALADLVSYLDEVSRDASRALRCDTFTLSAVRADDEIRDDTGASVKQLAAKHGTAFANWIWTVDGIVPRRHVLALSGGAIDEGVLADLHEDPDVRAARPVLLTREMLKLYLALHPHAYFRLVKYQSGESRLKPIRMDDCGTSRPILKRALLNELNLLSTAFRDRSAIDLIHLFVGVLPMTQLLFERGIVCAGLGDCVREYVDAGLAFHEQVRDAYELYRGRRGVPFSARETDRVLIAYGPAAMELSDRVLAFL
jgi:hypothetical protein